MEKSRIVVSGVNGFVGHHLAERLYGDNIDVIGIGSDAEADSNVAPYLKEYHSVDLTQAWPELPDVAGVIHLAGLSAIGPSFDSPQYYIDTNSSMVTNIGEFYLNQKKKPRILIISSGAIYDSVSPLPLTETSPVGFSSPYAVSKILVENQAAYYRRRGLDVIIARPFNHIGPGQKLGFILPDLFQQLIEARDENNNEIKVGNLNSRRDYTDVRDIVAAYSLLVTVPNLINTTYNISSGVSYSGNDILGVLKEALGLQDINVVVDPTKFRPTDAENIVGSSSRLQGETGWHPQHLLKQTITDFIQSKAT